MATKKKNAASKKAAAKPTGKKAALHKVLAKAIEAQDWAAAAEAGRDLVTLDPHDLVAISQTAWAFGNLGSWSEPLSELPQELLSAAPNVGADADAAMNLQFAIIDTNRPLATNDADKVALAMTVVEAFLAAGGEPKTVHHYNSLVNTYLAAGKAKEAVAIAEEGLAKHEDPFGYHGLACAYGVLGNKKKLFETLELAKETYGGFAMIQTDPDLAKWRKDAAFEAYFVDAIDPQDGREGFTVALDSIAKTFPKGLDVPALLPALGAWLARVPFGSLGYFEVMTGEKFHDYSLGAKANKAIASAVGIFMVFGEGSRIALWNHGGAVPAVVLIDSEGQSRTLAPSFEDFLVLWSKQKTSTELDGLHGDDLPPQQHAKLAGWLQTHGVKPPKTSKAPDFAAWVDSLVEE